MVCGRILGPRSRRKTFWPHLSRGTELEFELCLELELERVVREHLVFDLLEGGQRGR